MKKISLFLSLGVFFVSACDLQPKITALPDTVGEFISARYPTLLADPNAQPEIYNSAATDYGVYAAPELYGTGTTTEDYVLYASVDDYIVPPDDAADNLADAHTKDTALQNVVETPNVDDTLVVGDRVTESVDEQEPDAKSTPENESETDAPWTPTDDVLNIPKYVYGGHDVTGITIARGDTLYAIGAKYGMTVDEIAKLNNMSEPYSLRVGQKLQVRASREQVVTEMPKIPEPKPAIKPEGKSGSKTVVPSGRATTTRVELNEITIVPGDTLYSISRKYSIPVNDLAVMNNLTPPFALYAGQKVRVPNLAAAPVRAPATTTTPVKTTTPKVTTSKTETKPNATATKDSDKAKSVVQTKKATDTKQPIKKTEKQTSKQAEKKPAKQSTTKSVKKLPAIAARSSSRFSWPVRGKILSNYGAKNNGLFNDGINIGATRGATVAAAENGVVAYAGNEVKGMGNLIIIQHADGWMTVYAHMDSLAVRRGARVNVGQKIGTVGQTGKVSKPQLHFEVRRGTKAYNPIQYLKK